MRVWLLVFAFTLLLVYSVAAQTSPDFKKAFGKSIEVYSVSEQMWMTPEYAADGRVCFMRLYPKHIDQKTNYLSNTPLRLEFKEMKSILNKLVPPETRGLQKESFGQTATGGPAAWTTYGYEKVTFTFVAPWGPFPYDDTTIRKGEFTFSVAYGDDLPGEAQPRSRLPTAEDFLEFQLSDIQIVDVRWNDRKCQSH